MKDDLEPTVDPQAISNPAADPDEPPVREQGEEMASPEEQEEYDEFVGACSDLIYGGGDEDNPRVMPEIIEALEPAKEAAEAAGNPAILAVANTAVQVVQRVDTAGFDANRPVSDAVLLHGMVEVVDMLIEIVETLGWHQYSEEEAGGCLIQALDLYRPIAVEMGRATEEELQAEFLQIVEADEAGRLDELLPALKGRDQMVAQEAPIESV